MATFTQRNGRWRAQVRRNGRAASKTFTTKRDAEAWARMTETKAEQHAAGLSSRPTGTLAELITRYEDTVFRIKPWSLSKTKELRALKVDMGQTRLSELDRQSVVTYATRLRQRMSGAGARTRLSYLSEVLRAARDLWDEPVPLEQVRDAIAALGRQKMLPRAPARTRRPQPDEIDRIIAHTAPAARTVDLAGILAVLRLVPLRVGELLAIEWDDLRPAERAVVIRARKHPDITVKASNDYLVPLPTLAGTDTYALVADRPRYFERPFPYTRPAVSNAFWAAARALKITDLHLHDLRAGAISRLLAAGVPIPVVAHMSGHKNWKILARHYSRMEATAMHEALARAGI